MKEKISEIISSLVSLNKEEVINLIETPPKEEMGDFAFPCFSLSKSEKKSPLLVAENLTKKISKRLPKEISSIKPFGPYINFYLDKKLLAEKVLKETKKKDWGQLNLDKRKSLIEFSQPNTHKAFHVGHIRGTSIGESLSRIFEAAGNNLKRINYSGDTGMHIAKWIWCYQKYHSKEKLSNEESWIAGIYVDAVKRLTKKEEFQKEVNKINKKIEEKSDKDINKLWKETRKLSIDSWKKIYKELGTKFDKHYFESEVELEGKKISQELVKKKIAKIDDNATIIDMKKDNLSVWVLLRSDGTVLYSAKDLALAEKKFKEYPSDYYLVTIGDPQTLHFKQLQKTLELMKKPYAKRYNFLPFGMVRFPTGKMSSRTGQNILYSDFIKETKEIAKKRIEERSKDLSKAELDKRALIVSIAAIKYSMLKQDPRKSIIFDPNSDVAFEGNTGPYLLYSYARANSITKKVKKEDKMKIIDINPLESSLIKKIDNFPEIIKKAYENLAPNIIANYAYELAQTFNEFYHACPVIGSPQKQFRIEIVKAFKTTIKKSLELLGIEVLEKM
jgi:arginyl-tRNA synthetase